MSTLSQTLAAAKGILFDMDGVLIDSEPIHEKAILAQIAELGATLDDHSVLKTFKAIPEAVVAARLLERYPHVHLSVDQMVERKVAIFAGIFNEVQLIPGAKDFVAASTAAGRQHGLTTSAARAIQKLVFETYGFGPYFETIITGEDITHGKPHPEPYLLTASRLGLEPHECIVIEDSVNGILSGKAAGSPVIGITGTFSRELLYSAGADFVIDSYTELSASS